MHLYKYLSKYHHHYHCNLIAVCVVPHFPISAKPMIYWVTWIKFLNTRVFTTKPDQGLNCAGVQSWSDITFYRILCRKLFAHIVHWILQNLQKCDSIPSSFNIMIIICTFESMYQSTVMKMITIEDKIGFEFEKMY